MLKVQVLDPDHGWVHAARAGETLEAAWQTLAGYRRRNPADQHRLVRVSDTGTVTVIPNDVEALALADEIAAE